MARNDVPNASHQVLFEMRLEENIVCARNGGFLHHMLVRIAGNENDRRHDIPPAQTHRHIKAIHIRHLVVDHQAINLVEIGARQQRYGSAERAHRESVCFEKKLQRLKHIRIVVENANSVFLGCKNYHLMPRISTSIRDNMTPAYIDIDLTQSFKIPARSASRISSDKLCACILVMTLAR